MTNKEIISEIKVHGELNESQVDQIEEALQAKDKEREELIESVPCADLSSVPERLMWLVSETDKEIWEWKLNNLKP